MKHIPRKRFGQNFLVDRAVIARIVDAIDPGPADQLVEIGPGLGALTGPLLERVARLQVIELDRDLAARLRASYPPERLIVHEGDALRFDFSALAAPLRVVGNLPYNISTPLLFHMVTYAGHFTDLHFMLQREVVERMVAAPSTSAYGRLSVMLQYRFRMQKLLCVPSSAFRPVPKVASAVVRLVPLLRPDVLAHDESVFGQTVTRAFSHRRKTLRNALQGFLTDADLEATGIDPGLRAENLSVDEFVALSNRVNRVSSPARAGRAGVGRQTL
ncbi:MAG: 16S rRNA (adenine(1518)-N(6)/adenine(1519)-N(6))-dimethyltransferase [Betaproteobacteria bacterium RBG_16_64_18]|nr:MAG: 16S rRNA (adenine(1518)-N(6)/adenine(1519)-N(6))-dimethyltransferase [Betaproteobacteria bacterium RBG_16_64_18]OGA08466.1 MAG: 16S rRNA (adenine(1518)-N(6)/adenine(1519)-N(6))-dimethyltransferase [Betaproteobacteria bacterium RIFCSPLOWO2_02_FULL_65_20]OGA44022.1 MAG: 16S rRNA (adenine(1518)-N(6)/adenine(1519)-N(6))-dimethyltransferase [Betaproteobacteria bacterium RIFCSPLOWO2_12_FULL_65_110]